VGAPDVGARSVGEGGMVVRGSMSTRAGAVAPAKLQCNILACAATAVLLLGGLLPVAGSATERIVVFDTAGGEARAFERSVEGR
jgi:hypothetical protein